MAMDAESLTYNTPSYMQNNPHLKEYLDRISTTIVTPKFYDKLDLGMDIKTINVVYPIKGPVFAHVHKEESGIKYNLIQPMLTDAGKKKRAMIEDKIFKKSWESGIDKFESKEAFGEKIKEWINESVTVVNATGKGEEAPEEGKKVAVTKRELDEITYLIYRDIIRVGLLQPLLDDPYLEDLTCIHTSPITILHKIFGHVETDVRFEDPEELSIFLKRLGERSGKPPTKARPIVDMMLPTGARMNLIYAEDVSRRGLSFSVRRYGDRPLSITELINLGTLSPEIGAYLWICLENKMSMFICGESACGKTSTMNAMLAFIRESSKIYSVEDTPEIRAPHDIWQRLITRDTGNPETSVVALHLLRAALRSRPNYIVVGEIRGKEGGVAFQAIQTGHPVLSTFNATDTQKMIQRLTSNAIEIPISFIDNLNIALFQQNVLLKGRMVRRVISATEILKFSAELGGVITKDVFIWRAGDDMHIFRGLYNSYVLEERIAPLLGYTHKKRIYEDIAERARVLKAMVNEKIFDYSEVLNVIRTYQEEGLRGLWFKV